MADLTPFAARARDWTRARAMPGENAGVAAVAIASMNANGEAWPMLCSLVEWLPGIEAADIEAGDLLLAAERIESLALAFLDGARDRVATGH